MLEWQQRYLTSEQSERTRYHCCHSHVKSIFPRHREMFCLLHGLIYSDTIIHNDDKNNVLIVKNSFLTKTADAETRYKTQHTSNHVRKTLKCLLISTCFVFLFNSTNFELAATLKKTTIKKVGNTMSPLGVTYAKYATQVPDVVAYDYYECFSCQ